jgi:RNA polymerase sigma factor (sigma-70 family)
LSNAAQLADTADPAAVLALNEAFERLESGSPDLAKLVRLRFFAGLDVAETAKALGVSEPTVKRRWRFARAVLFEALERKV